LEAELNNPINRNCYRSNLNSIPT